MTVWATPSSGGLLDPSTLNRIVRRIVEVAQPERIILFGSAARGEMNRHSDVDLLVVKAGAHRRKTAGLIHRNLRGVEAAVDVVVVTPEDIERFGDTHALVIKPALDEGRVVYEAGRGTSARRSTRVAQGGENQSRSGADARPRQLP